jgi:hypothetical protein
LDWLAKELTVPAYGVVEHPSEKAWRLKRMHKLIMSSRTYRQDSAHRPEAARIDAESRLLWRYPPRRLDAEAVRDSMLAVSGTLDTRMGGPGFRLYSYTRDNVATYFPRDEHGPDTYRRAVYHQNARASRIDLITEFDFPDCALGAPKRVTTTSPLQALTLMNHSFTMDMATAFAARIEAEAIGVEAQIQRAFRLCFARMPRAEEIEAGVRLAEAHGLPALCRALMNLNEFIYLQ